MSSSIFAAVEMAPRDPILGLNEAFNADTRSTKVNLGVGVYFDDNGKIPLLGAVKTAEKARLEAAPPRGYQPIEGPVAYANAVQNLLFGADSAIIRDGRVVTAQALGGTGALRIGGDLIKRVVPGATVYISDPSWENHRALFEAAGFPVDTYPYYNPETRGANAEAMIAKLNTLPAGSVIVLHACCHNPTGADLTEAQWADVVKACANRGLIPFLDMAY
jgi:aromatic-amino-acid transaminase